MTPTDLEGFLRLPEVLRLYPISRSAWYAGVASGKYPPPVRLSARCVAWRRSDIAKLINEAAREERA